jgi:putative ABC transport system ATP-binding protein
MGESGVGKSTLLNLLAGLDRPTRAACWLEGVDLSALDDDARTLLRRRAVGFVFQAFHVLPYLTVEQNVALPLELLGVAGARAHSAPRRCWTRSGSKPAARRFARELSGGEVQRVAIARALVHRPRLVLADEPTGNLDPRSAGADACACCAIRSKRTPAPGSDHAFAHRRRHRRPHPGSRCGGCQALGTAGERSAQPGGAFTIWRKLLLAQLREQPAAAVTVLAIALGSGARRRGLLVNGAALNEFGLATKRLVGEADLVVRGPREGFPSAVRGARAQSGGARGKPRSRARSAVPGHRDTLKVLGSDPFRAAALQSALIGDVGAGMSICSRPTHHT